MQPPPLPPAPTPCACGTCHTSEVVVGLRTCPGLVLAMTASEGGGRWRCRGRQGGRHSPCEQRAYRPPLAHTSPPPSGGGGHTTHANSGPTLDHRRTSGSTARPPPGPPPLPLRLRGADIPQRQGVAQDGTCLRFAALDPPPMVRLGCPSQGPCPDMPRVAGPNWGRTTMQPPPPPPCLRAFGATDPRGRGRGGRGGGGSATRPVHSATRSCDLWPPTANGGRWRSAPAGGAEGQGRPPESRPRPPLRGHVSTAHRMGRVAGATPDARPCGVHPGALGKTHGAVHGFKVGTLMCSPLSPRDASRAFALGLWGIVIDG